MDNPEIRTQLLSILAKDLERAGTLPENVDNDLDLLEMGIVDSFGFINLCLKLEEIFGIPLDITEFDDEALSSIGGIVSLIAEKQANRTD